jgi:Fibronectin type III domain
MPSIPEPDPPEDLKIVESDSTSCKIAWKAPEHPNGIIKQYRIRLEFLKFDYFVPQACSSYKVKTNISDADSSSGTKFSVENLLPAAVYAIKVQAVNGAYLNDLSDFSQPQNCTTLPAPPEEVRDFKYDRKNDFYVFSWSLPCRSNGRIENFTIEAKPRDGGESVSLEIPFEEGQVMYRINHSGLDLNLTYDVTIRATNGMLQGRSRNISTEVIATRE